MPLCGDKKTKEELEEEQYQKDLAKCYLKDQIYIDNAGNLRYGEKKFDPEYELSCIVDKDDQVEAEGKIWYVISSGWMHAWLLYAHLNRGINPNPGRIDNESLLDCNSDNTEFVPKEGLEMAQKKREGDYRRISEGAWKALCEFYPGSGPAITMEFIADESVTDGKYDCSGWHIDQTMFAQIMDKLPKKKSLFSFGKNKNKVNEVAAPTATTETERATDRLLSDSDSEGMELSGKLKTPQDLKNFFGASAVKSSSEEVAGDDPKPREESNSWLFD